jgi:DNA-binding protein H-NS
MPKRLGSFASLSVMDLVEMRDRIDRILYKKVSLEREQLQARLDSLAAFESGPIKVRRGSRKSIAANGRRRGHPLKGRKVPVKYRSPRGDTWSGRGLAPRWLVALEKKGKKRASYAVASHQR